MRPIMMLLVLLELFTFALGLVNSNRPDLRNSTQPHKTILKHKSPVDGIQFAGEYDPNDHLDEPTAQSFADKGGWLNCLFPMSEEEARKAEPKASTKFKGTLEAELETWEWKQYPPHAGICNWGSPSGGANIKRTLDTLGLSAFSKDDGGDNVCYTVTHAVRNSRNDKGELLHVYEQAYKVNGKAYHRTGGVYDFGNNHVGGAIFARALMAPMHAAQSYWTKFGRVPTDEMMPELCHDANIMGAYWLRGNPDPKNLKHYIALGIENDNTLQAIATIMAHKGLNQIPVWPGMKLDPRPSDDWMGKLLLGSPIGTTIGFILLSYKEEIGLKQITEIVVFREDDDAGGGHMAADPDEEDFDDDENPYDDDLYDEDEEEAPKVHMVFKIEDVPPAEDKEDEEMPDVPNHGNKRGRRAIARKRRTSFSHEIERREYSSGDNVRVYEFRMV